MIIRPNPVGIGPLSVDLPDSIEKDIQDIHKRIEDAASDRTMWMAKMEKLIRQRKGVRKPKVFPWPGASNHHWPLTDGVIRRWKPGIVSLITDSDPVCWFFPQNLEAVKARDAAQAYYHWRFHSMHRVQETALELADYVGQYGLAYTRQGWDYQTRRKCRSVNVMTLFPGGIAAAVEQFNQQVDMAQQQLDMAAAQGQDVSQAPPIPAKVTAESLATTVLEREYLVNTADPMEKAQLDEAVKAILRGTEQVRFYYQVSTCDRPAWKALNPLNVIVPTRCEDIGEADFIGIEHTFNSDDILKMAIDGHFWMSSANKVHDWLIKSSTADDESGFGDLANTQTIGDVQDRADGLNVTKTKDDKSGIVLEIYCKVDINNDRLLEKIIAWYHPASKTVLSVVPYPYPFEAWPLVRFQLEHNDKRTYSSRGVAELISTFQAQVNKLHNARLDAIQVTLVPMFQMRASSADVKRNITFKPGAIIPVQNVGDIAPLPADTRSIIQLMQEENLTKNLAEQYVGIFDPSVMAQNSSERRTATEVEAVMGQVQSVFGQDAKLIQASMKVVHDQLWQLCLDFDKPEVYYRVEGEEMPQLARKHEIAFDYDIVPSGTPANTSKQLAQARAREAMQLFFQDQTGIINKYELYKWYFSVVDRNMGKIMVRPMEEAAAIQAMMQIVNQQATQNGGQPIGTP
jgi:hypothetical protein